MGGQSNATVMSDKCRRNSFKTSSLVRTLIGIANPKLRSSTALCGGWATASKVVRMAAEVIP